MNLTLINWMKSAMPIILNTGLIEPNTLKNEWYGRKS